jgi:uncharacterized phage-associated protein
MPTAHDVARYLVSQVDDDGGDSMSNLKLQKLLYYSQGFHLAAYGKPLFNEPIEAWVHGPVVPDVYRTLKHFGSNAVQMDPPDLSQFAGEDLELIDEVYSVYGQFSPTGLRNMTHDEPPWKRTPQGGIISHELMREFFRTRIVSED